MRFTIKCIWLFKLHTLPGQVENQERKQSLCHNAFLNAARRVQPQKLGAARAVSTASAPPAAQLTVLSHRWLLLPRGSLQKNGPAFSKPLPCSQPSQTNHLPHFHHERYSYSRSNVIILMPVHSIIQDLPKISAETWAPCLLLTHTVFFNSSKFIFSC